MDPKIEPGSGVRQVTRPFGGPEVFRNENREGCLSRLPCNYRLLFGRSDETLTSDLRRDRPKTLPVLIVP